MAMCIRHETCDQTVMVQLLSVSNDSGEIVHTHTSVIKQYNLVLTTGWLCSVAGKVTIHLAMCSSDLSIYRLMAKK